MKKILLLLLVMMPLFISGCESDDEPEASCQEFDIKECKAPSDANVCINENGKRYYTYEGAEYDFSDIGKEKLINKMCPVSSSAMRTRLLEALDTESLRLINEARSAAICR